MILMVRWYHKGGSLVRFFCIAPEPTACYHTDQYHRQGVTMNRIILDVDTGLDDAVALFLAAGLREITIEAVIATAGNVGLDKTLENTLNIMETTGLTCPVYAGSAKPLVRKPIEAGEFHGETGLDGPVFAKRVRQEVQEES